MTCNKVNSSYAITTAKVAKVPNLDLNALTDKKNKTFRTD